MTSRRHLISTAGTLTVAGLTGCLGDDDHEEQTIDDDDEAEDLDEVTYATSTGGAIGVVATVVKQEGFDKAHGIDLNVVGTSIADLSLILAEREVDTGIVPVQFPSNIRATEDLEISAFGTPALNYNGLCTSQENTFDSWHDLVGQRVGILPPPTVAYFHVQMVLAQMGYDLEEDFDVRTGGLSAVHSFDMQGDVDAHVNAPPPQFSEMVAGNIREITWIPNLMEEEFGFVLPFLCLAAYDDWIEEDRERARNVQAAILDATNFLHDRIDTAMERYSDADTEPAGGFGFESDDERDLALERLPASYPTAWGGAEKDRFIETMELAQDLGIIEADAPADPIADI